MPSEMFLYQVNLYFARSSAAVGGQIIVPLIGDVRQELASLSASSLPGMLM